MCPKNYEYHYIDRLRPTVTAASLLFGSAVDAALSNILSDKDGSEEVFEESFKNALINDTLTYIPTNTDVVYANADLDYELLRPEDWVEIEKAFPSLDPELVADKKASGGYQSLSLNERSLYNLLSWYSLRRKGLLMVTAFRKKVLPKIARVLALQEYIEIENEDGDQVVGYVDLVAEMLDGSVVIFDIKTSASEYSSDSVLSSSQLALYMHAIGKKYNTRLAGYIVMRKQIAKNRKKKCSVCGNDGTGGRHKTCDAIVSGKRCGGEWIETLKPEVPVQILVDEIPERIESIVVENLDTINASIKTGCFTRNLSACKNWYGSPCAYYNKCHKDDDAGLIKVAEREKSLDKDKKV